MPQTLCKCNIWMKIQLLKLSKVSTYHIWYPYVIQKDNLLRHHLLSNLLVTNLCVFDWEGYFLKYTLACFHPSTHSEKYQLIGKQTEKLHNLWTSRYVYLDLLLFLAFLNELSITAVEKCSYTSVLHPVNKNWKGMS